MSSIEKIKFEKVNENKENATRTFKITQEKDNIKYQHRKDPVLVEKGDIIVATMTTPDYVSAMEKASGFITDEGGITCHAAILSREFNVPCIVGTVIGTKEIQDGQMIELDAYTGKVYIIT